MRLGSKFVRRCAQGTLQFVIVKPTMAALSLSMLAAGAYDSDTYQWILLCVYNVSYTVALYALLCLYLAARDVVRGHSLVWKFVAVKTVVFLTYWQSLMVAALPHITKEEGNRLNDFVLCMEMILFAALHWRAFPPHRASRSAFALEEEATASDGGAPRGMEDASTRRGANRAASGGGAATGIPLADLARASAASDPATGRGRSRPTEAGK